MFASSASGVWVTHGQGCNMSDVVHEPLTVERDRGVIVAVGELDLAGGPLLDSAVRDAEVSGEQIVIDLADVTFVDSSGLRSLIGASQRAAGRGQRVRLVSPTSVVSRLLEITATMAMFDIDERR